MIPFFFLVKLMTLIFPLKPFVRLIPNYAPAANFPYWDLDQGPNSSPLTFLKLHTLAHIRKWGKNLSSNFATAN